MSYDFYIGKTLLPVSPGKLTTTINNQNRTINLINDGQVNLLKEPGLTEIDFEILLPSQEYPFARYKNGFVKPIEFLQKFEKLKSKKKPFEFIVARTDPAGKVVFDTDMQMSIESYTISEEEGFDVNVSLKLKQYKPYGTQKIKIKPVSQKATKENEREMKSGNGGTVHKVIPGDCLWAIAKKYYGDGSYYPTIYEANKELIDKRNAGTNLAKYTIYAGQELVIPETPNKKASASASTSSSSKSSSTTSSSSQNSISLPTKKAPFTIYTSDYKVVQGDFANYGSAQNYYIKNKGDQQGWKLVNSDNEEIKINVVRR